MWYMVRREKTYIKAVRRAQKNILQQCNNNCHLSAVAHVRLIINRHVSFPISARTQITNIIIHLATVVVSVIVTSNGSLNVTTFAGKPIPIYFKRA